MRKVLTAAVLVGMTASFAPARATYGADVTFRATPCAYACSYWLPDASRLPGPPSVPADPTTYDPVPYLTGLDEQVLAAADNMQAACGAPSPPGSFADLVVTAPDDANFLEFNAAPTVDWDVFICSKPATSNNGTLLSSGANPSEDTNCTHACPELAYTRVQGGQKYVLRAFNFTDPTDLHASYLFSAI